MFIHVLPHLTPLCVCVCVYYFVLLFCCSSDYVITVFAELCENVLRSIRRVSQNSQDLLKLTMLILMLVFCLH